MTLAEKLRKRAAASKETFDERRAAVYRTAAEALAETYILETALREGDEAPTFELPDAFGNTVSLSALLDHGPVIVSFYRGPWCPFCSLELAALQRELDAVERAGATLVAISPNRPDLSASVIEEHGLSFPVLSDTENRVARQFGIVYEMEEGLIGYYREIDRDVAGMNGSMAWELPVPATYVIDRDGVIRYAFVDLDHRVRAEPAEVAAIAAALPAHQPRSETTA